MADFVGAPLAGVRNPRNPDTRKGYPYRLLEKSIESNMAYDTIKNDLKGLFERSWDSFGMLVLEAPAANLIPLVTRLKDEFGFALFLDVTAVDYPEREPRFDVVYHFYSVQHNKRLRIKTLVPEADPTVATLTGLYGSANFMEREVHEMYGIEFAGNPDLRPILLYEGFVGHPLRKDYPIDQEQPLVDYRMP
jgi:NADH-quinone oxidoreductase subunit C